MMTESQLKELRRAYRLNHKSECDAADYGLQHGKSFDEWFVEEWLPEYRRCFEG